MGYDFFNSLTPTTGHHAGLYASEFAAPTDRNADASIRQHLAAGIPPDKLVLGVAFYGRGFAGVEPLHDGLHRPYDALRRRSQLCRAGGNLHRPRGIRAPLGRACPGAVPLERRDGTRSSATKIRESIRTKMDYVREKGLGGMMFWELSQDRSGELLDVAS